MQMSNGSLRHGVPLAGVSRASWSAWVWVFGLLLAAVSFGARGDDDLPGRVGRVAEFGGELFLAPEDPATQWEPIGLNYPITSGDNLWVSGDGRAEVDYGGGQFRLAGDTNLHVPRLDDRQLALFLAQGRVILRVRVLDPGDATRVDTPNTQVALTRPGLYRIEVTPDRQQTTVTVRDGEALVGLANTAQQVLPGQMASVYGPDPAYADIRNSVGMDGFDTWSADRDRRYESSSSTAYVSRQMVGYADLDEYGTWQTDPEYGAVWFPMTVASDWAPYRDGYWANVGDWGYTWVDSAPWGYAPFHYGRWAFIGGRWGWAPGAYVARPVWAPALVGWFGGGGWGVSGSAGAPVYGWVPLGWGEPYLPWWRRCSNNCWTHYNRPYNVNVAVRPAAPPRRYTHVGVPGAITAVPATAIASRRPVSANLVAVPSSLANSAPVIATAPAIAPRPPSTARVQPGAGAAPRPASTFVPNSRVGTPPSASARASSAPIPIAPWVQPDATASPASQRRPREVSAVPGGSTAPLPSGGSGASVPAAAEPRTQGPSRRPRESLAPPAAQAPAPPVAAGSLPPPTPRSMPSAAPGPGVRPGPPVTIPAGVGLSGAPPAAVAPAPPVAAAPAPVPQGNAPAPQGNARPAPRGGEGTGRSERGGEKSDASPAPPPGGMPK